MNIPSNIESLGSISYYNGLLFGDFTATQADCEGALAVGGNAQFGAGTHGYDIGGAGVPGWESIIIGSMSNPYGYPALLLGGEVSANSTTARVYTGGVVMALSHQQHYEGNLFRFACADGVSFAADELCEAFFARAKSRVCNTSDVLTRGNSATITAAELQTLGQLSLGDYENENIHTTANMLCFNLACNPTDSVNVGDINLTDALLAYDAVVINIPAAKVTFAYGSMLHNGSPLHIVPSTYPGNLVVKGFSERLIFNFPNASEVDMLNYSVIGSIIAPNAAINGMGGSINGMLAADSLLQDGGMELHAFTAALGDTLWELNTDPLTANVSIVVQDTSDDTGLSGALFSLYQYNEETQLYDLLYADLATSANGELVIEDLPLGSYKLAETHAPMGYALPEITEVLFEIKLDDKGEIIQLNTIHIENAKLRGNVLFSKIDAEDAQIKLEGAVFSLFIFNTETDKFELLSTGHTTLHDGSLVLEDLLPGSYKLVETAAPEGYYLGTGAETLFTVALDTEGDIIDLGCIDIENTKLGCVQIIKKDSEDALITLPGALFTLQKLNTESGEYENIRTGLATGAGGVLMIEDLYPGEYKLIETKAPYGYKLPSNPTTPFTVVL